MSAVRIGVAVILICTVPATTLAAEHAGRCTVCIVEGGMDLNTGGTHTGAHKTPFTTTPSYKPGAAYQVWVTAEDHHTRPGTSAGVKPQLARLTASRYAALYGDTEAGTGSLRFLDDGKERHCPTPTAGSSVDADHGSTHAGVNAVRATARYQWVAPWTAQVLSSSALLNLRGVGKFKLC